MRPRQNIEDAFAKHVALFPGANKKQRQQLFRSGKCRYSEIMDVWYCQALWANLHTCCYGNQTTGQTLVPPPSVDEYLSNYHAGRYV
eukprot:COSAG01_NODE_4831_length_4703_cov_184.304301_2_plen_87_part_00